MKKTTGFLLTIAFLISVWPAPDRKTTDFPARVGVVRIFASEKKTTDFPKEITGLASYYSRAGCIGCSPTLTMANGEPLDDTKLTISLDPELVKNNRLLNKFAGVINIANKKSIIVKITDTGGFTKYNRVADLSLEAKKQLNCLDLCKIIIIF